MATNKTDFSSYPVGSPPSDWVITWVTTSQTWAIRSKVGALGGKTLEHVASADARRFIYWSVPGSITGDVEVLIKWRTTDSTLNNIPARAHIHTRGTSTQSTQYAYTLDLTIPSTLRLGKTNAGTYGTLASATLPFSITPNTWYWYRLRRSGNSLYGKCWQDSETEPVSWNITTSDTAITYGYVGIGAFDFNGTRDFDFFSYGTGGDSAPDPTIDMASTVDGVSTTLADSEPFIGLQPTIDNQSSSIGNILLDWNLKDISIILTNIDGNITISRQELYLLATIFCTSSTQINLLADFVMQSVIQTQSESQGILLKNIDISGIVTAQSSIVNSLDLDISLQSTTQGQSSTSIDMEPLLNLSSEINGSCDVVPFLTRLFSLQGLVNGSSDGIGTFINLININTLVDNQTSIDTNLTDYFDAQSLINISSQVLGTAQTVTPIDLSGIVNIQSTDIESLDLDLPISSTINLQSDASGVIEIAVATNIAGIVNIQSSNSVALGITIPISSIINNTSDSSGVIEVVPPVDIAGTITASSSTLIALEIVNPISSIVSGSSSTVGDIIIVVPTDIQSIVSNTSFVSGTIDITMDLRSTVEISSSSSGSIVTVESINIQGITSIQSSTLGAIRDLININGVTNCISSTNITLGNITTIQGSLSAVSLTDANLTRILGVQGIINIISSNNGSLTSGATHDLQGIINNTLSDAGTIILDWSLQALVDIISTTIVRFEEDNWILKGEISGQSEVLGYLALIIATQIQGSFINNIDLIGSSIEIISLDGDIDNTITLGGKF